MATIRRTATGKWFITIACEWEPTPLPLTHHAVGMDVGLHSFATRSDTVTIANPRFFSEEEMALAKAQRQHQVALDTHKAKRADVTHQAKAAHPDLSDEAIWKAVSHNAEEHAA
jgi:transposase